MTIGPMAKQNIQRLMRAHVNVEAAEGVLDKAQKDLAEAKRIYGETRLMGSKAFGLSAGGEVFALWGERLFLLRCVDDVVMRDPEEVLPFVDLN